MIQPRALIAHIGQDPALSDAATSPLVAQRPAQHTDRRVICVQQVAAHDVRAHSDQAIVIKEKRAAHALLRGRVKKAYRIFTSAAQTMHSSDALEMARLRNEYHKLLYDHEIKVSWRRASVGD
jgi:hypothetical protein